TRKPGSGAACPARSCALAAETWSRGTGPEWWWPVALSARPPASKSSMAPATTRQPTPGRPSPTCRRGPHPAVAPRPALVVWATPPAPQADPVFLLFTPSHPAWQTLARPPRGVPYPDRPAVLNPTALLWTGQEVLVTGWYGLGIAPVGTGG